MTAQAENPSAVGNGGTPAAAPPRGVGARLLEGASRSVDTVLDKSFDTQLALPLAMCRITLGCVLLVSYGELMSVYDTYFAPNGVIPIQEWPRIAPDRSLSFYKFVESAALAKTIAMAALGPMVLFTLGLYPRLMAALSWYALVSVHDRCPLMLDGADFVIRLMLFFFIFAESDARLAPFAPLKKPGSLGMLSARLLQLQIATVYFCTGFEKVMGAKWRAGTALAYAIQLDSFSRADWTFLSEMPLFINGATYTTLLWEMFFPFLVYARRTRAITLVMGVALHMGIEVLMYIPIFSWAMISTYPVFFFPAWAETLVTRISAPWKRAATGMGVRVSLPADAKARTWLPRIDIFGAVQLEDAPTSALRVVVRGKERTGVGAWLTLARAVPSLTALLPLCAVPGGAALFDVLFRERSPG
jgi:hypothetical protein